VQPSLWFEHVGVEFFQGTGTSGWGFINDEENHRDDVPMAQNRPHNNMPLSVAVPLWERTGRRLAPAGV
jgi:hypothetical protein